ncbi:hypothetical protein SALBM311S_07539 [Streptomyces alboniger]
MDSAAAQDEFGEPVVDVRGSLDDPAAVPDDLVGALQVAECGAGLGEEVRGVDGGRGQRREGSEQSDLLPLEDPGPPVRREQDSDHMGPERQRHPEDGDQALVAHARVDDEGVLEAVVLEVVVGDVRPGRLGDEAAEPLPHPQAQLLEAGRDRAFGDPHVGVTTRRVVETEVRHVRAQQRAGALHDRRQDRVQVAQPGQVVGRLEERGQLGLPSAPALQLRADAQGERLDRLQCGDLLGRPPLGAGDQHRLLIGVGGRPPGEELQERRLGAAGRARLTAAGHGRLAAAGPWRGARTVEARHLGTIARRGPGRPAVAGPAVGRPIGGGRTGARRTGGTGSFD